MISGETYTHNLGAFSRWLDRVSRPVTEDLRSAIWKNTPRGAPEGGWSRENVLDAFIDQVSLSGPKFSPHMEDREQKELEYFLLPWSERPAWNDWGPQKVEGYYNVKPGALSTLDRDMQLFDESWGVSTPLLPFRKAARRLPSNTNSGLPWLESHWGQNIGGAVIAETSAQWAQDNPREIPPSMPMWRVDPPGKVRFAWAESKYEALYGAPFVYTIQDAMRKKWSHFDYPFAAWEGQANVGDRIQRDLERGDYEYISCDYSSFDQTQSPELLRAVGNNLIHPMVRSRKPRMFKNWLENLISGTVVTPDKLYSGEHGMPSGSVGTNFIDSINNALCITGYLENYSVSSSRYWVQGDDAVIRGHGVDPKDFAEFAKSEYGFNAHPDKQYFGHSEVDFLQHSYYRENDYLPTYPASRVGWRMVGHERFRFVPGAWNEWAVIVRAVQQMNNAIDNPSVKELARWASEGDSMQLGAWLPPKTIFQKSGVAGRVMTTEKSRWNPGSVSGADWDVLPIQGVIREVITE